MNSNFCSVTLGVLLTHAILTLTSAGTSTTVCAPYSKTSTSSANTNYEVCSFQLCPGDTVTASVCPGDYTGDTYFRLFYGSTEVAANDDYCDVGSQITYQPTFLSSCATFDLRQGCFSLGTCTGTTTVVILSDGSTAEPSALPSAAPTRAPTALIGVDVLLPAFSASNTNNAAANYVSEYITICPTQEVLFTMCESGGTFSGDTYLRLYLNGVQVAVNDDFCSQGSAISYFATAATCQSYELRQGCYGNTACSGRTSVVFVSNAADDDDDDDDDFSGGCSQSKIDDCIDAADGEWGQCDMCVCYLYDNLVDSDKECGNTPTLYNCFYNIGSGDVKCKTEMKLGWILGFTGIGLMLAIACCAGGALCLNGNTKANTTESSNEGNMELQEVAPSAPPATSLFRSSGSGNDFPGVVAVPAPVYTEVAVRGQNGEALEKTRI